MVVFDFYSRPCGRGDATGAPSGTTVGEKFLLTPLREGRQFGASNLTQGYLFLLTPLREGRPDVLTLAQQIKQISTHAPAGGATLRTELDMRLEAFLLTPLREGRRPPAQAPSRDSHFYSRPCGRGDNLHPRPIAHQRQFLLTPLREGRLTRNRDHARLDHDFYSRPCGRGDGGRYLDQGKVG